MWLHEDNTYPKYWKINYGDLKDELMLTSWYGLETDKE